MRADSTSAAGLAAKLVAENFSVSQGHLQIGGIAASEIARLHGTPSYVYDAAMMRTSYRALKKAISDLGGIYYSIKANPNPEVVRIFVEEGAGLEVASAAEYERALAAGCEPDRVLFAGPGKTDQELEHVVRGGIGEIHVESEYEIERLGAIARRLQKQVDLSIRVNPAEAGQGGAMRMGGRPSPFGIDEERLEEATDKVAAQEGLNLTGVHLFAGTQILDAEVLGRQWRHGLEIAARVARHAGKPLKTIDLGGGLGIPYFAGDATLDLVRVEEIANELAATVRANAALARARVLVEPGRFLAGPGGVYLVRVLDVKLSRGERFVVTDGGMHHHLAASGNLGQVIKRDYPLVAADRIVEDRSTRTAVVGPLCTPLDTLARNSELPELRPGDLIAVLQSGAYGLTASPVGFLSHPMPAEVLVDEGNVRVIRPRGTFSQPVTTLP